MACAFSEKFDARLLYLDHQYIYTAFKGRPSKYQELTDRQTDTHTHTHTHTAQNAQTIISSTRSLFNSRDPPLRDQPKTLSTHSIIAMLLPRTTTIPTSFVSVLLPATCVITAGLACSNA